MLLHLNLAYFLPSLPTLLLQSVWDARLDSRFGIAKAATVRLCLGMQIYLFCVAKLGILSASDFCVAVTGLGGSTVVCALYPFFETSRTVLLVLVALLGLCNSVAFSTSYQVVTHFATGSSVALTTGGHASFTQNKVALRITCKACVSMCFPASAIR